MCSQGGRERDKSSPSFPESMQNSVFFCCPSSLFAASEDRVTTDKKAILSKPTLDSTLVHSIGLSPRKLSLDLHCE